MKRLLANLIKYFSVFPITAPFFFGVATIVTLHRVGASEVDRLRSNESMKISPEFLEEFIRDALKDGYKFISLDELHDILKSGRKSSKNILITLDDGYADNFDIAYPIFKKYRTPFCVYIATALPDKTAILWWYVIEDLILENDRIELSNGEVYDCTTINDKESSFLQIRKKILSLDNSDIPNRLEKMFSKYNIDWVQKSGELSMDWSQVVELSRDSLVTIGGHTVSHPALSKLSKRDAEKEILKGNDLISSKIRKKVEHFSYPFGGGSEAGAREFEILRRMRIKTAVTTRRGSVFHWQRRTMEQLPRVMLTEGASLNGLAANLFKENIARRFSFLAKRG